MSKEAKRERRQSIGFVSILISLTAMVMSFVAVSAEEANFPEPEESSTAIEVFDEVTNKVVSLYPDWILKMDEELAYFSSDLANCYSELFERIGDDLREIRENK